MTATTRPCEGEPPPPSTEPPPPSTEPPPPPSDGGPPPPPGSSSALFVSTSGSDANPCTQSAPCASFDRAYHAARPGAVVEVAGGSYPSQRVTLDSSKASPVVVFRPASGAQVTVNQIVAQGSWVEFNNMKVAQAWSVGLNTNTVPQSSQSRHVTFRNVTTPIFFVNGASNVSVIGGSVGPTVNNASQIRNCYLCNYSPQNTLVDGVYFHDYTRTDPAQHMECLHVYPAQGLSIQNSRFFNCAIMDLFFANYGSGGNLRDITLVNNMFNAPGSHAGALSGGYYPVLFAPNGGSITNVSILYNSFNGSFNANPDGSLVNWEAIGNASLGQGGAFCLPGVSFSHNVFSGGKCGSTDRQANPGFISASSFNLDLAPGAAAIDAGDPSRYPGRDIHGTARYLGKGPDAGADEAG